MFIKVLQIQCFASPALQFHEFRTEENTDFVELYDGGVTLSTSEMSVRLSGSMQGYTFISSYNFMTVKFTTDSSEEYAGFRATWNTSKSSVFF